MNMRKWVSAIAAVLVTSSLAWAAGTTLSNLSASGAVADADTYYTVQTPGSGGVKATALKMYTYIASKLAPIAASGSASDLGAGTVPAARMPALTGDCVTTAGAVATTCNALPHPGYISSNWYTPFVPSGTVTNSSSMATQHNIIRCFYGAVAQKLTISTLGITVVSSPVASGNMQAAIYASANGRPGALISNTGNMSTAAAASVNAALGASKQVGPGGADGGRDLWWCFNMDATAGGGTMVVSSFGTNPSGLGGAMMMGSSTQASITAGGTLLGISCSGANCNGGSSTFNTWPASLTGSTWTDLLVGRSPLIGFQVSSVP